MSGYTGTQFETLFSNYQAATTTTPTAGAVTITGGYPAITVPGMYFSTTGKFTRSLRMIMSGLMTATATVPTWQLGVAFTTTDSFAATPVLAVTGTYTPTAGTGAPWFAYLEIGIRTIALGASSTVVAMGQMASPLFTTSPFMMAFPATGSSNTVTTWDIENQYYLWPYLTLGAATAGNTITTQVVKLYGEN